MEEVDICENCEKEFGFSGEDENGYNSTCVHCGHNIYYTENIEDDENVLT